jgi:F-box interacting protein
MEDQSPELPDHVLEDIFARLPAKSVLRCRCLSRAWAATLSSEDFVDRHRHLANRHGGPRILFLQDSSSHEELPKVHTWSPGHPGGATLMEVPPALRRRHRCPPSAGGTSFGRHWPRTDRDNLVPRLVTQHCRGLVILEAAGAGMHFVFNPSTGQMAALPEGRSTGCRHATDARRVYASLGIGYDESIKKHKVVRIWYRGCNSDNLPASVGCEVYVVNSTGNWRPASGGAPAGWVNQNEASVFAQGHVHWLGKRRLDSPSEEKLIISFSLAEETFGTLQLPPDPDMETNCSHYLTELGGRLCLFSTEFDKVNTLKPHRHHVWLLREHETSTWDLHCQIDVDTLQPKKIVGPMRVGEVMSPLCFMDDGRRNVLVQPRNHLACAASFKLHAYAPATGDTENLLDRRNIFKHAALYQ